jgi:hypothetical protein
MSDTTADIATPAESDRPELRAAPIRIGPVGRAPTERWLQANGLPACVQGHSRPGAVLARPLALLSCAAIILGLAIYLALVADLSFGTGAVFIGGAVVVAVVGSNAAVVGSYAMTAVDIPEVAVFTVGWFARTVWRTGSGLTHVLPLLLVAVTFFFLAGEELDVDRPTVRSAPGAGHDPDRGARPGHAGAAGRR